MQNTSDETRATRHELIDTHAHLDFEPLIDNIDAVLRRSIDAGITRWITVGTNIQESKKAVSLTEKYDNLYAAVGIHPHYAKDATDEHLAELAKLAANKKVVAIGETGLDFHYNFPERPAQKQLFEKHLALATQTNLPLIIHSREAFEDTMQILEQSAGGIKKIVFHCFTGTAAQAKVILDKGCYISFTGVVTFKHADDVRAAAKVVPLDRIMLETDCPYMSPAPMRKHKTNEPAFLIHTANFIAKLKSVDFDELCEKTTQNALHFFNLT